MLLQCLPRQGAGDWPEDLGPDPLADLADDAGVVGTPPVRSDMPAQVVVQVRECLELPVGSVQPDIVRGNFRPVSLIDERPAPSRQVLEGLDLQP
jgi:hypothetical protein